MRKQDIEKILNAALIHAESHKTKMEYEKMKQANDILEEEVNKLKEEEKGMALPNTNSYTRYYDAIDYEMQQHKNKGRNGGISNVISSPESIHIQKIDNKFDYSIPSLPSLNTKSNKVMSTGRRHYKNTAHSTSRAPWERPPSRGALKETARRNARSKYIQNTNMLYYKSGDELGLEVAGDDGKPTLNYDGKVLYPLNRRHPYAKPPNPRDSSKIPPYAADVSNDKDRFIHLGSVKPLFSSPYMKSVTPRSNDNDRYSDTSNYLNEFLKYKKQDDQVEVKKRQQALKQKVYDPSEHKLPRPPLEPELNKLGRARKRRREALYKKYGKAQLEKIFIPKPPKRKERYKKYKRAGRYDIYKQTNDSHQRVRGIRQRRSGRKTIFTEEEEMLGKEIFPRRQANNEIIESDIYSDSNSTSYGNGHVGNDFDDNASRITEIGNQLQQALRAISRNKLRHHA